MPQFLAAFEHLGRPLCEQVDPPAPIALGDSADRRGAGTACGAAYRHVSPSILSGDGGWAGLDKEVAGRLERPWNSRRRSRFAGVTFWSARTSQGLAADIDRMIRYYLQKLGKKRVLLIGYSQGADVLTFRGQSIVRLDSSGHRTGRAHGHVGARVVRNFT